MGTSGHQRAGRGQELLLLELADDIRKVSGSCTGRRGSTDPGLWTLGSAVSTLSDLKKWGI